MRFSALALLGFASWLGIHWNLAPLTLDFSPNYPTSVQTLHATSLLSQNNSNCPADLETLTALLLRDLPSYANRVIQRTRLLDQSVDLYSYIIIAGQAEFEPLSLGPGQYTPVPPTADLEPPQQVFFTTLERRYGDEKAYLVQNYHWLFLTRTPGGWRLAMAFSRLGSTDEKRPPLPPIETSDGVIGQAVELWLRDCRAGEIRTSL